VEKTQLLHTNQNQNKETTCQSQENPETTNDISPPPKTDPINPIDPIEPIDPILPPPPPPPPPGTDPLDFTDIEANEIVYATAQNPIYIATDHAMGLFKDTEQYGMEVYNEAIAQIKHHWPKWNGKNGTESNFNGPTPTVEAVPEHTQEWADLNLPDVRGIQAQYKYWATNATSEPYKVRPVGNQKYYTVFKIYNTYWANQGPQIGEVAGQKYYQAKSLWWLADIIKLPTEAGKQPLNGKLAFAGNVQETLTIFEKQPQILTQTENALGMFYEAKNFNQQLADMPNLKQASLMHYNNKNYNKPAPTTPELQANAGAYHKATKLTANTNALHSEKLQHSEKLFMGANAMQGDISTKYNYPLIAQEPQNYRTDTAITKTYWG